MAGKRGQKLVAIGSSLAYLFIGLEVLFMITPFALYFYSVYEPLLRWLGASPLTAWTAEFFLPHVVFVDDPLLVGLSYLQLLFVIGLLLFLLGAVPLYYGRILKKGVVTFGFYARIRHPQYLFLGISGFGLLLYWPRFIILIAYVTMLFVYFLLARNEEWRMRGEQPVSYEAYMARTWMFLPGEPGGRLYRVLFGWLRPAWLRLPLLYLTAVSLAVLVAMGLRGYTVDRLPRTETGGMQLVSVYPRPPQELQRLYAAALVSPEVRSFLTQEPLHLAYVMPGDFFLTGLLMAEGPRYSEQKLRRYPQLRQRKVGEHSGGLAKFFRLGYKFFRTIGTTRRVYDVDRIVFTRTHEPNGTLASPDRSFAIGVVRTPALVVDLDFETGEVLSITEVSGRHSWGELPMPIL